MRSKTAKQILSETPEKVKDKVRKYGDHVVCRDFKLLVREYFYAKRKMSDSSYRDEYTNYRNQMLSIEKRILSELERFTQQEQKELPFGGSLPPEDYELGN